MFTCSHTDTVHIFLACTKRTLESVRKKEIRAAYLNYLSYLSECMTGDGA